MNLQVSTAVARAQFCKPGSAPDLDASLKAAIAAYKSAARKHHQHEKALEVLRAQHAALASDRCRVKVEMTDAELDALAGHTPNKIVTVVQRAHFTNEALPYIRDLNDFLKVTGFAGQEAFTAPAAATWSAIDKRLVEAGLARRRAREQVGLTKAEQLANEAYTARRRALKKVLSTEPATRAGCRALAKLLLQALPNEVGGPINDHVTSRENFNYEAWQGRRSNAMSDALDALRLLAR